MWNVLSCFVACSLPKQPGPWKGSFPRYYYDYKEKKCGKFIYGGCGGNENNFETLEDCQKRCRPNIPGTCSTSIQIDMDNQFFVLGGIFR